MHCVEFIPLAAVPRKWYSRCRAVEGKSKMENELLYVYVTVLTGIIYLTRTFLRFIFTLCAPPPACLHSPPTTAKTSARINLLEQLFKHVHSGFFFFCSAIYGRQEEEVPAIASDFWRTRGQYQQVSCALDTYRSPCECVNQPPYVRTC